VASGHAASAQSPENVAVVVNDNSAASQVVARHYVQKRAIPEANVIHVKAPVDETVERPVYLAAIEQPIADALARGGLQDRILYIVLTKGVPLRVAGSVGESGTMASVDSELTLLYRKMVGLAFPAPGFVPNPYFLADHPVAEARRFSHRDYDIYLVTRLDAFTVEEAQTLVDAASMPTSSGLIVLDQRNALVSRAGEDILAKAAETIRTLDTPERVMLETTSKAATTPSPVLGYFSWGATDPQLRSRFSGLHFAAGAIAATFAGSDARTFQPPPPGWTPMKDPTNRATWFGGAPQSLIGDLIREGVTGAAGSVAEPFLQGAVRPDVLFPAYISGFNLVESFYLATPYLSWQTVVVGDPLCQPFARKALTRSDTDPPADRATELPEFFGQRQLRLTAATLGGDTKAAALVVRSQTRMARGDRTGARAALVEATTAAPKAAAVHLRLAMLEDALGDYPAAVVAYRRTLELEPENVLALNNLAFSLAVHGKAPAEAKPLATRAVTLSNRNPNIVDTLGWIEYLLGDSAQAVQLLADAARRDPMNADIRLHAAFAYAAAGDAVAARTHLAEAIRRNPALERESDVVQLRDRLKTTEPK
jgi:uncharacterized protein (TIGR03790 family)